MSENVARPPVANPVVNQRPRKPARGLMGQVSMVIFQPAKFFAEMPTTQHNRQWAWMGLLLLIVIGFNSVQQYDVNNSSGSSGDSEFVDPMMGMDMGGGMMNDPFMPPDMGMGGGDTSSTGASNTSTKWEIGLVAGAGMVFVWFAQVLILSQVSLFKGQAPVLSDNLQIVIWATVPLGLMALFQMFFRWTGGTIGEAGLLGLMVQTSFYQSANPFLQAILKTLASHMTLFWLWSLVLIYIGARHVLQGRMLPSILAVVMWVVMFVAVPHILNPPQADDVPLNDDMGDFGGFPDGGFPMDDEFGGFSDEEMPPFDDGLNGDEQGMLTPDDEFSGEEMPFHEEMPPFDEGLNGDEQGMSTPDDELSGDEVPFDGDIPLDDKEPMTDEAQS
jgi:hypothetical protein